MSDNRIFVKIHDIDETDRRALLSRCRLTLFNAGGLDGDWWEIESELRTRPLMEVLNDYFVFGPTGADIDWQGGET